MTRPNLSFDQKSSNMSLSLCLFVSIWGTLSVSIPFPSWEMTIVMELEPQYPLIWLWSRKVERRWVVIWSWLDGKVLRHFLFSIIDPYIAIPLSRSFFFSFFLRNSFLFLWSYFFLSVYIVGFARDFDVHVVVELYFSELKASRCRKVVVTRLLMFLETWIIKKFCSRKLEIIRDWRVDGRGSANGQSKGNYSYCLLRFKNLYTFWIILLTSVLIWPQSTKQHSFCSGSEPPIPSLCTSCTLWPSQPFGIWTEILMIWVRCTSYTSSLLFSFMQFDGVSSFFSFVCIHMPILKLDLNL